MPDIRPTLIANLTPEAIARLTEGKERLDKAKGSLELLKRLGLDVTEFEEKLDWARKIQEILFKEFIPK